jgi:spermidine synthase
MAGRLPRGYDERAAPGDRARPVRRSGTSVSRMEHVDVARSDSERGELVLRERRGDGPAVLELRANGVFVMDSAEHASEYALAEAALDLVERPSHVLVGGLGLGFTLDRVLGDRRVERCTVVEIEPALVEWMRDGTIPHGPRVLADQRVHVVGGDIAMLITEAHPASYDVVLLDVDNGPAQLVHEHNASIYEEPFLAAVREVLTPGGVLVIWSAERAPGLARRLEAVFDEHDEHSHQVKLQDRDEYYWLYVGRSRPRVASAP